MDSTTKKKITLAGREFEIPCLPFKKNRVVIPSANFAYNAIQRTKPPLNEALNVTAVDHAYLAVFEAVSYVDAKVTREIFDAWEVSFQEIIVALVIVALQTGVIVLAEKGEEKAPGEA